jgi:hypothetical protein
MTRRDGLARKIEFVEPVQAVSTCPVPLQKIFLFSLNPNHFYIRRCPAHTEGRFAIVTNVGAGCGGRVGAFDEQRLMRTAKSYGPDASTLASSS